MYLCVRVSHNISTMNMKLSCRKAYIRPCVLPLNLTQPRLLLSEFSVKTWEEIPIELIEDYGEL